MIMKNLGWCTGATTDEEFAKILNGRKKIFLLAIVLGVFTNVLSLLLASGVIDHHASFMTGMYSGMGGTVWVLGLIYFIQTKNIIKDKARLRKVRLEQQDERKVMISQKSMSTTAFIMLVLLYIGILVAGFINMTVFWMLYVLAILSLLVYIAVNMYYNDKY